ncbi:hypothetical protein GB931_10210 [Modestobacter sp. I12A-02628]|uniref:DUF559 domain-containing protein n=2 Tax=Goekera deserti TaxID=2497753 RepID=A0A7K3WBL7_9ACTN|nr:hypothetical protein [Goekera deserti]NDI48109.1 hypothetical protein [Goekera deserti]NEL53858.1 hypothetical protein [Goekera deserti]
MRPSSLVSGPFRGTDAVHRGLLTRDQLRGRAWCRLFPDVYCDARLPATHMLLCRAGCLAVPRAVVTGRSAAVLWGVDLAGTTDTVELTVPPGSSARTLTGVRVRRARLTPEEVTRRRSLPVTTPLATAVEVARTSVDLEGAVIALDRLVVSGVVDLDAVRRAAHLTTGRGCGQLRRAADLADGLAESPQETRLRLLLGGSGLPRPVAQHRIVVAGVVLARVDFGWPERKVAVEYDGSWHAEPGQFAKDRRRLNRLTAAGWRIVFVTAADLYHPAELVARIAAALAFLP